MSVTIKGMNLKDVLYLFKDAVARAAITDVNTKMTVTQDDIDEVCITTEQAETVTSTETEGDV